MIFAQTKKVAILEVVDREGKLSYGNKMMTVGGCVMTAMSFDRNNAANIDQNTFGAGGMSLIVIGAVVGGVGGGTLLGIGYKKRNKAYDMYNNQCASSTPLTFNLTAGPNGLGVAMNF